MEIKVLGTGCPACRSMHTIVTQIVAHEKMDAQVEYVQDIERILAYGVMTIPALVIDGKVVMLGLRSTAKIEQALRDGGSA